MTLAEKIRALLAARELTPYWLAQRSGVKLATLDRVLRGGVERPLWETVQRIAAALEISTDELRDDALTLPDYEPRGPGGGAASSSGHRPARRRVRAPRG